MISPPTTPAAPFLATAHRELARLPRLAAPGKDVTAVITGLNAVRDALAGARPLMATRRASEWMLGELDRVHGSARTLSDSLNSLVKQDGMRVFDPSFAADKPSWDSWFVEAADIVTRAQNVAQQT